MLKAIDVINLSHISASLPLYSQWENDRKIPSPETLEKICNTLGANKKTAFFLWAKSNMPSMSLKKLFEFPNMEKTNFLNQPTNSFDIFYPASVTKTIQERDIDFFIKNPAAGAILMRALSAGNLPEGSWPFEKLVDGLGIKISVARNLIKELINRHYIIEVKSKYRTPFGIKYIYMPETSSFERLRKERILFNTRRVLDNINLSDLKNQESLRINFTNKLNKNQMSKVISALRDTSDEFLKAEDQNDQKYFQLLILVGPEYEKQ